MSINSHYMDGMNARSSGHPERANPHSNNSPQYRDWAEGWHVVDLQITMLINNARHMVEGVRTMAVAGVNNARRI